MQNSKNGQSLIDFVSFHGTAQLDNSLIIVHDWVLYDSNIVINERKKDILNDVKQLSRVLRELQND